MDERKEVLKVVDEVLDAIFAKQWPKYSALCKEDMSSFEPEGRGTFIEGLGFHKYYFSIPAEAADFINYTRASTNVRFVGGNNVAIVTYILLYQKLDPTAVPITIRFEETRILEKEQEGWKQVHFHRSLPQ